MIKNCIKCNKEFKKKITCSKKEWATSKFCSHSCANSAKSIGNKYRVVITPWNKNKMCLNLRGKNHHSYKDGGIARNSRHTEMGRIEYKLWRKSCMERDSFTCQKSGLLGGRLEVHHINNYADFPELRFAIDNGITLSKESHKEFHKLYGKSNNTKLQLLAFLGTQA